ncbi:MAG: hypothetical protein M3Y86_09985 [Verrucomicrobiota bacterium]|nr:hypothetical protein [Verrucomicrobiota bacterium]
MIAEFPAKAPNLGFDSKETQSILDDCAMELFLLTNVGTMADSGYATLHGFADVMEHAPLNSPEIPFPTLTSWPATMPTLVKPGIAARRARYVAKGKSSANYDPATIGRTLRWEAPSTPFVPADYVAQLNKVTAIGHEQVPVQIGKGGGEVTAARLMMRRKGDQFAMVAQFTARTMIDRTALKVPGQPEEREYQLIALKNDEVIGQPARS